MAFINFSIGQGLGITPFNASGVLEAVPTSSNPNVYQVIGATGTIEGQTITGVGASGNNLLYPFDNGPGRAQVDQQGFSFTTAEGTYRVYAQIGTSASTGSFLVSYGIERPGGQARAISFSGGIPCFVSGTRIATTRGAVEVEALRIGDTAVTAPGALRPIIWIGSRTVEAAVGALPFEQQPMRIAAGAFGDGLPARKLYLSPGHPVLVGADADSEGGALVPIMCLENGTSIRREPRAAVTYWHVELDAHDILLAEGLPAESYIDGGDRAFFAEASDHTLHNPDFVPPGWGARCRPVAINGPLVEGERLRLNAIFAASLDRHSAWPVGELAL